MKANIHPDWYPEAEVTCACGNSFTTGASFSEMRVQICSACHPFYTGKMRFVDTKGRVQKFKDKQHKAAQTQQTSKKKNRGDDADDKPQSLKDMLEKARKNL